MASITYFTAYEAGGAIKPGEMANIVIIANYTNPPVDAMVKVEGFGHEVTYGPYRDFTNPLILMVPFQIPKDAVVPGVTITGYPVGGDVKVAGQPQLKVSLYILRNGEWVLAGSKTISVNVAGLGTASGDTVAQESGDNSIVKLLLGLGVAYLLLGGD